MGKNNRQRRADKKRRSAHQRPTSSHTPPVDEAAPDHAAPDQTVMERLLVNAAMSADGRDATRDVLPRAVHWLVAAEAATIDAGTAAIRPIDVLATLLQRSVDSAFAHGWQPADLAHLVKRELTQRAHRLAIALIAEHSRRHEAATRAPRPWLDQLEDLGVVDPARSVILGGHPGTVRAWARTEKLDPDEILTTSLHVLSALMRAPRLALLIPPPASWGATNRGSFPARAPCREVDTKALKLIRALLAKAEATNFEAEAETFTAKAQEMMTRHSIDAAVVDAADQGTRLGSGVESQRVHIDNPYADEKVALLAVIAAVNGARSVWSPQAGFCTVVGFPVDLRLTDLLFTSLLVQATRASAEATAARSDLRTPSFRRAFMLAFADRIGERLEATRTHAAAEAEQHYGSALVPVLADRAAAVDTAFAEAFPNTTPMRNRRVNASGYHAGRAAADRANIGAGAAIAAT